MVSDARIVAETILAGRYRLVRLIDRGGMAEVWEGKDEILDRPVAIKILHPRLAGDDEFQERFRLEAVAAARLAHPNVVATFDTGIDGGMAYIVMELVAGRTLRELLRDEGPLAIAKAATDPDLTQRGALLGTAKYLAPEQVSGQPQDRRSDVYGLGVVLYEMLRGK